MEVHAGENRNGTALRKGSRIQLRAFSLAGRIDQSHLKRQIGIPLSEKN